MRIAVDARELLGRPTGVGRYLTEIIRAWNDAPDARGHDFILCAPQPVTVPGAARLRLSSIAGRGTGTAWEQWVLPRLLRHARADVLFAPAYSGPVFCPVPMVVSIHDVSFAAHPEWFGWREGVRRRLLARLTVRRAARVLTLTRFSRDEIVAYLGADPNMIDITYAGVSALAGGSTSNDAAPPDGAVLREPRVLFVGSILERRHVPELIAGFGRLASRRPEVHLDIVGDQRATPPVDLDAASAATGARDRIHTRAYISDSELVECYRRAGVFAWLSSYEGFGLTPLEALAARIPIVVLDTAVAREVYGDAAIYVPAPRPDVIDAALERALFDPAERQRVLTASRALLERYSWKQVAAIVLEALLAAGR